MDFQDLIAKALEHYNNSLPFVAYRKPNQSTVKLMLQKDDKVFKVEDFSESGFVFAPFNDKEDIILIPFDDSDNFQAEFNDLHQLNKKTETQKTAEILEEDKTNHIKLVEAGVKAIASGEFKKVVLSRKETVILHSKSVIQIFTDLLQSYPSAFVYCWYHPKVGMWLGATPETLLKVENNRLSTMALAGTQKFSGNLDVTWGEKERQEQQFVTNFIADSLQPFANTITLGDVQTVKAGKLLHLQTKITATINGNLQAVLKALHPTPAVCGLPKQASKNFILNNEYYKRTYYTGFLGELNLKEAKSRNRNRRNVENNAYASIKNISDFYVNLRCMEIEGDQANIFVGGGITEASNPIQEWEETVHKSGTMKQVL
ncbi:chorismate-binding protein [Mangrovimonas spongiae]|uniref:Isochorismate synthase n=1 Tax=Mangrovimonas spongiae TaxID=2494697 RepID=A0A3R9N467_9FLAO|nr:chorismate-binding protein [Mangrovimonas spongiae]RSK38600.1 isochorismate synthase [Mangrovimonas spongiae]